MKQNAPIHYINKKYPATIEKASDIILSPEYYWCKKIESQKSSKKQVLEMAESVFATSLPKGEYKYICYKIEGAWLLIAYDVMFLKKELSDILPKVKKIYLAQELQKYLQNETISIAPNEKYALVSIDGIVVQIPNVEKTGSFQDDVFSSFRFSNSINLRGSNENIMDTSSSYQIATVALVFLLAMALGVFNDYRDFLSMQKNHDDILNKVKLPKTSFERKSIIQPLETKAIASKKLNKSLLQLKRLPIEIKKHIYSIVYAQGEYTVLVNKKEISKQQLEEQFSLLFTALEVSDSKDRYKVRILK